VVDRGLGQHGVVLELRLPQRRGVASDDDELRLAGTQALEGGLVAEGDPTIVSELVLREAQCPTYLPDFITSARRELMESAVLLFFLGAIFALRSV
jgi:hypothetical protein